MNTKEALDYAIFAINTLVAPDVSSDEDFDALLSAADEVIAALSRLRNSLHDGH